jgi:hypothetical protein
MAFTPISTARHSLLPSEGGTSNDAVGFASCYGPHRRSPWRTSDAGLRRRAFPDIPYYVSGEVTHWRNLAHRTSADLEATGMRLRLDTAARRMDVPGRKLLVSSPDGTEELLSYDKLVVGTGAVPVRPPISGLDQLGPADNVHLLHSMGDTFALMWTALGLVETPAL